MKVVLPGKPEARLQAVATGFWNSRRIITYISGNAIAILSDHETLIQTIYDDDETHLEAVALDEVSGKIAVCTHRTVRIYKPFVHEDGVLRWAWDTLFTPRVDEDGLHDGARYAMTLSWGNSEELLASRSASTLYQTTPELTCTWRKLQASPVKYAELSYDSAYVASVGYHDRLVKVWRRLSYVSDDVRFDFIYLSHPQAVTALQWRRPYHVDQTIDNVLYTFCLDNVVRIWTGSDSHNNQHLQLWGRIDLAAQGGPSPTWAAIVHGRDFSAATETVVQEGPAEYGKGDGPLVNVVELANRNPELCIAFDGHGKMSAWAMENISSKPPAKTKPNRPSILAIVKNIASDDFKFLREGSADAPSHVEIQSYCNKTGGHLSFLFHFLDGRIEFFESNIARLLDANASKRRIRPRCMWTGHSASIVKMVRNYSGRSVVSRTSEGETVVWKHPLHTEKTRFTRQSILASKDHIHRIAVIRKGRFVVFLHHDRIAVWDCRQLEPSLIAQCNYKISGNPLCLLVLPRQTAEEGLVAHIATITSEKKGLVWEIKLPSYGVSASNGVKTNGHENGHQNGHEPPSISEFFRFELQDAGDLAYVLPVDPAGSAPMVSGFLDVFARDVAVSYTHTGRVEFWTTRVGDKKVDWLSTASMETGISEPALASGSTMKKAALVNSSRTAVTIWDIKGARLEYNQEFESQNAIQDLDWTSTPDSQSILAVGFPSRVLLLAQMRFDYLNKGPAWAPIREINIRDFTPHPIGDSTWLGDGYLVIGAGNQLFVHDRKFDPPSALVKSISLPHKKGDKWDLFDVVQRLNGPLPVFHPQFLSQCMLAGKVMVVHRILLALHKTLKFWVEGDEIDDYLGLDLEEFYIDTSRPSHARGKEGRSYFGERTTLEDEDEVFGEDMAQTINEKLTSIALPQLTGHEQIQLVDMIECIGMVEKHRRSMDENGARFMIYYRQHALLKRRTNEITMSWREINWAYHSTSQDMLTDFVSRQNHGSLLWEQARESGMFMWLTDNAALKTQFEIIARNEYTKSEMKNPVDCSLFYFALHKKAVVQGLWRMASWNREQRATQKLLANNFDDPKWKTTALKNAYALLSKRRFDYSAAFFLLAGRLQDAVNVCLNQLKDLQLAIAIARVYEGDHGPVLRKLLEEEVLSVAAQEGNRWLASWAFWMLHRRDMAVRALITPVYTLVETPMVPNLKSKLFLTDDPALIVLYAQLRQKTLQTLRGASKVTPRVEWEFVLHNARLYDRMGCDLLGLDLVRNWEFLLPGASLKPELGGEINPLKLLKRRSSLVVADLPVSPLSAKVVPGEAGRMGGGLLSPTGEKKPKAQPPPTMFEEPDASSLLDNFGF
ncbi:Regulator of V-ATPase in vacuolar membrane protein 1 [Cytospora mali]|uniref:Regulator of V-ATPase in vacuolar membrane protein 1 n=1 Tax=Cytospora mali TaxID=578113 RepID=A0A194VSB8_CYTMA|nr:Regulator of V-ATPase in vacuolar membrane protein 1 [Valsa mali]